MDEDEIFEADNIFDEDDAFDCMMFREAEKEEKGGSGGGCLTTILISISTCCGIAILAHWMIG